MSCGLGAIILVFMLIKHNSVKPIPENETDRLLSELVQLEDEEKRLRQRIDDIKRVTKQDMERIRSISKEMENSQAEFDSLQDASSRKRRELSALEIKIKDIEVEKASDVIEEQRVGEEDYVIGLKVEGRKIGILIDSSASMTDEFLIDIIRRKNDSDESKKAGPKWQRVKRIVNWLLARLPENASVSVIAFNDHARPLGGMGWRESRNPKALESIARSLEVIVPEGPTNLEVGLKALTSEGPTNIYLITDGFPTLGDSSYKSLNPFANCSALWGDAKTISGKCRKKLFEHTLSTSAPPLGIPVNVILLPIEGDPEATAAYWSWSSITGGLLISPAAGWP